MKSINLIIAVFIFCLLMTSGCRDIFGDRTQPQSIVQPPLEPAKIVVTNPEFGTIKSPGDTIEIKWFASGIQKIKLQLFRKNEFKFTIAKDIENNSSFMWKIPFEVPLSNHYLIKVISNQNENIYEFSGQFGIE